MACEKSNCRNAGCESIVYLCDVASQFCVSSYVTMLGKNQNKTINLQINIIGGIVDSARNNINILVWD